ncbi:MAG TPA: nitroreductase family protein [Coriobacteriia bacterium]|nr:nitroreductase family protein [Coriobacteriia bacterium]
MDALDAIMSRRSIRRYTGDPATREQIETVLRAAQAAPSANNQQPWRFIVLTGREALAAAAATSPYARMLADAAFGIVVCGETEGLRSPGMWQQDCSAAVENALLAAHALGLGAVWLGYYPKMERVTPLKELLGIPESVEPLAILSIGHPAEDKPPSERYDPALVHFERWQS